MGRSRKICGAVAWRVEAWIPANHETFLRPARGESLLDATAPAYPVVAGSYTHTVHSICLHQHVISDEPVSATTRPVDVTLDFLAASNVPIVPFPILQASTIASEPFTAPPLLCHGNVAVRRLSTSTRT